MSIDLGASVELRRKRVRSSLRVRLDKYACRWISLRPRLMLRKTFYIGLTRLGRTIYEEIPDDEA